MSCQEHKSVLRSSRQFSVHEKHNSMTINFVSLLGLKSLETSKTRSRNMSATEAAAYQIDGNENRPFNGCVSSWQK